jgi:hypothetical protein
MNTFKNVVPLSDIIHLVQFRMVNMLENVLLIHSDVSKAVNVLENAMFILSWRVEGGGRGRIVSVARHYLENKGIVVL